MERKLHSLKKTQGIMFRRATLRRKIYAWRDTDSRQNDMKSRMNRLGKANSKVLSKVKIFFSHLPLANFFWIRVCNSSLYWSNPKLYFLTGIIALSITIYCHLSVKRDVSVCLAKRTKYKGRFFAWVFWGLGHLKQIAGNESRDWNSCLDYKMCQNEIVTF